VFIWAFTDLGTPLVFEYREVIAVQIFNMVTDLHQNPMGYAFVGSCRRGVSEARDDAAQAEHRRERREHGCIDARQSGGADGIGQGGLAEIARERKVQRGDAEQNHRADQITPHEERWLVD
jgi:hypothetical protein